jgi:mycothiol synthase
MALERNGFAIVRYFYRMVRPLDRPIPEAQLPEGYVLRHVENDSDIAAWVDAYNNSFIDHWNHHPKTIESHKHWLKNPHYRPERDLIAVAPDGTIAAFCFCMIDSAENARSGRNEGWIDKLGTRRGYRRQGLGKALLVAGMRRLKEDGVETACLGVDTNNPSGALKLYAAVGFEQALTSVVYRKSL